ncbi:unnamed protein product, partial [Didymodactylos carnosus]
KGNSVVILDKSEYIKKAHSILKAKQFLKTKTNMMKKKEEEMNQYLRKLLRQDVIDKQLFYRLRLTCSSIAVTYGQPKAHKINYPLRPIISNVGSYNYELSKYLTKVIEQHRPEKSFSFVKDTFDFVKRLRTVKKVNEKVLVSFDVDSLFTNVPVDETIEIILKLIYKSGKPGDVPFERDQFKQLLEMAV